MSELSIKELNANRNVKNMLLNQDSKNIAAACLRIKQEKGIDIRLIDGKLVAA